mmetsp:Transcript_29176/g.40671  ORF Transcript_29176/g.40671 Transcript_29176/m.40671 type:complete len:168 (-) Transcript_29176:37-540(-)|eukprot:CAMPEP_0185261416 /NCGR_PEP_ID=MMETSP1359-20130426/9807_1 /TAXON_ID=552665 /ORGANISM="Bigelowiella longifila, Strain CCMP242" /LENGTH=167 /DNA_ID=CAMNT_0027848029 /DNA_START=590 /DNA_END=1093 /DNA_ORIENTATION=+
MVSAPRDGFCVKRVDRVGNGERVVLADLAVGVTSGDSEDTLSKGAAVSGRNDSVGADGMEDGDDEERSAGNDGEEVEVGMGNDGEDDAGDGEETVRGKVDGDVVLAAGEWEGLGAGGARRGGGTGKADRHCRSISHTSSRNILDNVWTSLNRSGTSATLMFSAMSVW